VSEECKEKEATATCLRLLVGLTSHTREHTSRRRTPIHALLEEAVGDIFQRFPAASHSVWGRVVPDIPDFCRELVAALAEE
jgi:hypothetical protein